MPPEKLIGKSKKQDETNEEASKGSVLDSGLSLVQLGALGHTLHMALSHYPFSRQGAGLMFSHICATVGVSHPWLGLKPTSYYGARPLPGYRPCLEEGASSTVSVHGAVDLPEGTGLSTGSDHYCSPQ